MSTAVLRFPSGRSPYSIELRVLLDIPFDPSRLFRNVRIPWFDRYGRDAGGVSLEVIFNLYINQERN